MPPSPSFLSSVYWPRRLATRAARWASRLARATIEREDEDRGRRRHQQSEHAPKRPPQHVQRGETPRPRLVRCPRQIRIRAARSRPRSTARRDSRDSRRRRGRSRRPRPSAAKWVSGCSDRGLSGRSPASRFTPGSRSVTRQDRLSVRIVDQQADLFQLVVEAAFAEQQAVAIEGVGFAGLAGLGDVQDPREVLVGRNPQGQARPPACRRSPGTGPRQTSSADSPSARPGRRAAGPCWERAARRPACRPTRRRKTPCDSRSAFCRRPRPGRRPG